MKIPQALRRVFAQPRRGEKRESMIEEPPQPAKRRAITVLVLAALASLTFLFGANRLALFGPDEPRYAEIAREMFASGDYITPTLGGCPWFEKPVLFYWLGAAAYHVFGVNEFAARLPSGVGALVTVLAVYWTLSRVVSQRWATLAAVIIFTSGMMIAYAHAATPDMTLTAAMAVAILAGYRATLAEGKTALFFVALSLAATALASLAKGLVGIVLVIAILFIYLLLAGRLRYLRWSHLLIGALLFAGVAASWYLPVTLRHGWEFVDEFFYRHHFRRYVADVYGHPQPVYFFPFVAAAGVLPWTFFLLPAVARLRHLRPRQNEADALLVLAWVWLLLPLIFFSLSESKLPGYLLPVFPALAILLGAEVERFIVERFIVERFINAASRLLVASGWLTAGVLVLLSLGFVWYLQKQGVSFAGWQSFAYVLPPAFAGITLAQLIRKKRDLLPLGALLVVGSMIVSGALALFPKLNEELSLRRLSREAAAALKPGEKIGYYILKEYAAVFYAQGRVVCDIGEGDVLNALREDKLVEPLEVYPSLIFITRERWIDGLQKDARFETEFIARQRDYYAFRVRLKRQAQKD